MVGGRWTLVLKGAHADRPVVGAAFLVVLLSATLVAAIPIYAHAVAASALRQRVERAPVTQANLQATVDIYNGGAGAPADRRVTSLARDAFGATGASIFRSGESEPFGAGGRIVVFGFYDGISRHARLAAGRWPSRSAGPVELALPASVARELGLRVGDEVRARSRLEAGNVVTGRVVGIYRPVHPASVYWWDDPLATGGYGPLVTTRRSFFALGLQDAELHWRIAPRSATLTIGQAARLQRELARLPRRLNAGRPAGQQFTVETGLRDILASAAQSLHLARAGVLVPSIQLALLAVYGLIVTTGVLSERRRTTIESLRLRGATVSQIVVLAVAEAVLVALPAVAVAPWLAAASLHALNHLGPLASIGLHLQPMVSWSAYGLAAAAGAVCIAGLAYPALHARGSAMAEERSRRPRAGFVQRARLDLVLAVVALLAYWQLRHYHGVIVSHGGSLGIDPFLVVAPAVLLLAGGLLALRLVPLAARAAERVVASTDGTVPALGLWQLSRRPRTYARSLLLLVLAVAIGVFATTYGEAWHRSQVDQARYAAGADVLVEPGGIGSGPPAIDLTSTYRALGAADALPAVTDSFDIASFGAQSSNVLALDARRAARVVHPRSDFAAQPLARLLSPLARDRGSLSAVPLPGRPERLALTVRLELSRRKAVDRGAYKDQPSLFLYLQDGDGVLYLYHLRPLPPGNTTRFSVDLVHRLRDGGLARPRYPLALVALELDLDVPYIASRRATLVVRSLEVARGTGAPWQRVSLDHRRPWRGTAVPFFGPFTSEYEGPRVQAISAVDGSLTASVSTGSNVDLQPNRPTAEFVFRPGRDVLPSAPPILASDRFLAATGTHVGQTIPLTLWGGTHPVRIAGAFHRFPTLDPATPAVIVDLPTYLAFAFAEERRVVRPSWWWLETGLDSRIAEQLRTPSLGSVGVVSRVEQERALLDDPVPLGVIGALALGFVVAAAFAIVGFAATTAGGVRARELEFAVLRALGLRTKQLSGWIGLEMALVLSISLLCGTGLGLLVSWLVLPYVALATSGAAPVPPVQLVMPWGTVFAFELTLLAALLAFSIAEVSVVRRIKLAPVLRSGEGAAAP